MGAEALGIDNVRAGPDGINSFFRLEDGQGLVDWYVHEKDDIAMISVWAVPESRWFLLDNGPELGWGEN